jgi:hypothetical protein
MLGHRLIQGQAVLLPPANHLGWDSKGVIVSTFMG